MTDTIARLRVGSLVFETMVDLNSAIKLRKGEKVSISEIIRDNNIYHDLKKGLRAGKGDLEKSFGSSVFEEVVERIVKKGEIEETQDFRDESVEQKKKQIIDYFIRNAVDGRTGRPFTHDIIESSIKQSGVRINGKQPVDKQISMITESLKTIIPIKIETKKILIKIPAQFTGQTYGLIQEYKEKENWLSNGDLEVVLNLPIGLQSEFYDKLNSVTHGSAITQELKQEDNPLKKA